MKKNGFWTKFLAGIGVVLLGFAVGYGMLSQKVEENAGRSKENTNKINIIDKSQTELKTDIKYIIKAVDEIRVEIKNGN